MVVTAEHGLNGEAYSVSNCLGTARTYFGYVTAPFFLSVSSMVFAFLFLYQFFAFVSLSFRDRRRAPRQASLGCVLWDH